MKNLREICRIYSFFLCFQMHNFILFLIIEGNMKRKNQIVGVLEDMFAEDDRKRINSVKMISQVANSLGPQRTKDELIPFLNEFMHEEPPVMLAVIEQISKIKISIGSENEKLLLNPLLNFCYSDQQEVIEAAINQIKSIIFKTASDSIGIIKNLAKQEMKFTKIAAASLIILGLEKFPQNEAPFIQIFKSMILSDRASFRISLSKYVNQLSKKIKDKEQILKILQFIYNDSEQLPKLLTIQALIEMYPFNSNFVMNKLKMLAAISKWRFDMKLCEYAEQLGNKLSKINFRLVMEPAYLKMLQSPETQIRSKSCDALQALAKNTSNQNINKLISIIEGLSTDKSYQVKANFAKNLVKIFPYIPSELIKEKLIPIVLTLLKENRIEISTGIIQQFHILRQELKNNEKIQKHILGPLLTQLNTQDWRLRVKMLNLLGKCAVEDNFVVPTMIDLFITACLDRIQAIRCLGVRTLISIIKKNQDNWVKVNIIPKLAKIKESKNYLIRQKILVIIEETASNIGRQILSEYRKIIIQMLKDSIPNVRMLSMKIVLSKQLLLDKQIQNQIEKLKQDTDFEIRQNAKLIKI